MKTECDHKANQEMVGGNKYDNWFWLRCVECHEVRSICPPDGDGGFYAPNSQAIMYYPKALNEWFNRE